MGSSVQLVRGRARPALEAEQVRRRAASASLVHIDVGTGDGRLVYRLARAHPTGLFIGVDANADRLRDVSYRASRKPARGGVENALFVRASLADLPGPLERLADRVTVLYPWGSLLRALLAPEEGAVRSLARLGGHGARFEARVNDSAADLSALDLGALRAAYRKAGIELSSELGPGEGHRTSWAARVSPRAGILRLSGPIGAAP